MSTPSRLLKKGFADFATFVPLEQGMGVAMRGDDQICGSLFSYIDLEARVETGHPLRAIREIANTALAALSREFEALDSGLGRPSIPPEKLLRAMLLQAFYSVRSERQLMERIKFDLLFRWAVGIGSMIRCGTDVEHAPSLLKGIDNEVAKFIRDSRFRSRHETNDAQMPD